MDGLSKELFDQEAPSIRVSRPSSTHDNYVATTYDSAAEPEMPSGGVIRNMGFKAGHVAPVVLALGIAACGDSSPGTGPTPIPDPAKTYTIEGSVNDRIDGSPIEGSDVQFTGPDNKAVKLVNGHYKIVDLKPGDYQVSITGPSHVPHRTIKVPVTGNDSNTDFTVLEYGSSNEIGVTFDKDFETFYDAISRCAYACSSSQPMIKWDPLPNQIYVIIDGMPEQGMTQFMDVLQEVNKESVPYMFGDKVGQLPIVKGPAINENTPGKVVIKFWDSGSQGNTGCPGIVGVASCGSVKYYKNNFGTTLTKNEMKYIVAHELFHAAGASHAYDMPYSLSNGSLMSGDSRVTQMAPVDKFAFWIKYNDGTKPGNTYPDTNSTR
jgi:hypothetical protein